jgi:hypothetical protein
MFVFDILEIPIGCTAPRCNPLATGLTEYRATILALSWTKVLAEQRRREKQRMKTAQIWYYIKI